MRLVLLGAAAGGGVPQWNCWCAVCRAAREAPPRVARRTQSALAVSADGAHWFLCNASPDVHSQLARLAPSGASPEAVRWSPVEGVVLTDAELDHTLGLPLLREAGSLTVYATSAVLRVLECDSRLLALTRAFSDVTAVPLAPGAPCALRYADGAGSGLTVEAVPVVGEAPRFAAGAMGGAAGAMGAMGREIAGGTVALLLRDVATGGCAAYVPGCGALDDVLMQRLAEAAVVFFDGTCWHDDDLARAGAGTRTARQMGHLRVGGERGSLAALAPLGRRLVYTHINNTNPMLLEDSPERRAVDHAGAIVGEDGMCFTL